MGSLFERIMDLGWCSLDLMLVPLSLCLTAGYHAYLWRNSNCRHPTTTLGVDMIARRAWLQDIVQEKNEKKQTVGVQSCRNALMSNILSATTCIIINSSLAALANNTYNSNHLLKTTPLHSSQGGQLLALKYASASLLLLFSFMCSSMSAGCFIQANFLVSVAPEELAFAGHVHRVMKRGWVLGIVGNRVLYTTFTILFWMLGPVPLALSSVGIVWVLYSHDFSNIRMREVLIG